MRTTRIVTLLLIAGTEPALAHERWVRHELTGGFDRSLFTTLSAANVVPTVAVLLAVVALLLLAVRYTRSPRAERTNLALRRWEAGIPTVISILFGLNLCHATYSGFLFAPDLVLTDSAAGTGLLWVQGICGACLVLGLATRVAGLCSALLLVGALSVLPFHPFDDKGVDTFHVLNYIHVIGVGSYLAIRGRPRFSVDCLLGTPADPLSWRPRAMGILRFWTGVTLIVLGLQKWIVPELPIGVVQNYGDLVYVPFRDLLGISVETYVFAAGMVEWSVGLLILLGIWIRPVAVVLAILFSVTGVIFHVEVIGHAPLFGIVAALFIEGGGAWTVPAFLGRSPGG